MHPIMFRIIESVLFATALSTDSFIASLAYGSNKIRIPLTSMQVIASICTGVLGLSLLLGTLVKAFIPAEALKMVSFSILFLIGLIKLLDNLIKMLIDKYTDIKKEFKFNFFSLNFILYIYANPKEADCDQSKILSIREALSLALALSIDSLAAGIGAAIGSISIIAVIISSLILCLISIKSGELIGKKISDKSPIQISWLGGALLILLAFLRLH